MNRTSYAIATGLMAACMATATASAQNFMAYEYGASADAVSQVSVANLAPNWVVTGVRNGTGLAEVITWESTGHSLVRKGSATGTAISNVGVSTVALNSTQVITASIADGLVELMSWTVDASGGVQFAASLTGESAKSLRVTKLDATRVVGAVEDVTGDLTITVWEVSSNGSLLQLGTHPAYTPANVTSIAAMNSSQVVTAIRTGAGDLQLDSWSVNPTINIILHQETASAGAVSELDIAAWNAGHVATPLRNSADALELIDWIVDPTSGAITRHSAETVTGDTNQVAVSTIGSLVFTASVNSAGKVDAEVWGYNGSQITAGDSAQEEAANLVAAAPLSTGLDSVTATRTAAGNLKVDVWSGDFVP